MNATVKRTASINTPPNDVPTTTWVFNLDGFSDTGFGVVLGNMGTKLSVTASSSSSSVVCVVGAVVVGLVVVVLTVVVMAVVVIISRTSISINEVK